LLAKKLGVSSGVWTPAFQSKESFRDKKIMEKILEI
jgi:hypothetical protein